MSATKITVLNAIGCLLLAAVIVVQWNRERGLNQDLDAMMLDLGAAQEEVAELVNEKAQLQADIESLKESLALSKKAVDQREDLLDSSVERHQKTVAELKAMQNQVDEWRAAIDQRDAQLKKMNAEMVLLRDKLDEAVKKLNEFAD